MEAGAKDVKQVERFSIKLLIDEESKDYIYIDLLDFDKAVKGLEQNDKLIVNSKSYTTHLARWKKHINKKRRPKLNEFTWDTYRWKTIQHNLFHTIYNLNYIEISIYMKDGYEDAVEGDKISRSISREGILYIIVNDIEIDIYNIYKTWELFEGSANSSNIADFHGLKMHISGDRLIFTKNGEISNG